MNDDTIQLTREGPVATLTLNRPEALNSLGLPDVKALLASVRKVGADDSVRALILTGAGRGFCAGWQLDPDGVPGLSDESLGVRQAHLMAEYFDPLILALHELPIPSIAAVNGVAAGMGVSIALAADIVLAADDASFVLTFAPKLGLVPDLGATWKLPRLIGWQRTLAVAMLGERVSAQQALDWGMIWRKSAAAELPALAMQLAERLAAAPRGVCREVRLALHAAQFNGLAAQMDDERLRQRVLLDLPSFAEGVAAFQQKRAPRFHDETTT
jgi:2-(1,2-epoxy-1,2-dihydrophenyl)acetyl-CoA isomerase